MMPSFARLLAASVVSIVCAASVSADVNATIAQARAYLGSEAALEAVTSVRYVGTLITLHETAEGPKPTNATIEIIFQKPYQQRIVATSERGVEVTALDEYDAWQRVQDAQDSTRWRMDLLLKDQLKRLRANTWENLAFFRGIEKRGGKVEDHGDVNVDGVACRKLAFVHEPGIVFFRYFSKANGKLILTETEQGGSIREEGEMVVNGIRFPRKVITTSKLADGTPRSVTVTFDKVTVNEKFPESLFAVPSLLPR